MTAVPERTARDDGTAFLTGGGEMGRRIAALDPGGPLGPVSSWSTTLRTAVGICVSSRYPMVIWWGPELVLLYNDAWVPILGPAKHPALGRPGAEVWPEMWHIIGRQLSGVLRSGEATWSDDQLLPAHRFGYLEEAYFTYSYSPIRTDDGQVAGVFTAVTETTSRVLGERRLRMLREIGDVAQASDLDQACMRTLTALSSNRADIPFAAVYLMPEDGAGARLVATEGLDRAVLPETLPPAGSSGRSIWRAVVENRTVESSGLAARLPGLARPGHSPVGDSDVDLAWAIPLTDAGRDVPFGVLVLAISPYRAVDADYRSFLDLAADQVSTALTDVQAHEAERRRTTALAELDRAKTEFFTGVSHELRTPLTLIAAPAQDALSDRDQPLPPAQRDRVELIRRNSARLRRLVDTLLDFARLEGGRLTADRSPVDLAHLTRGIAGTFAPAAERAGLQFGIDCPDLPGGVLVDPEMWERIVLNLLSNAVKYTFDGRVDVRLRRTGEGTTELAVSDTGVGIPAADRDRVFERFHRVRGAQARSAEGTGIGLALVAELVALHGGEVGVRSTPGGGSTFVVVLPAAARTDLAPTGARVPSSAGLFLDEALSWVRDDPEADRDPGPAVPGRVDTGSTGGATVLVVDDNADLRWYIAGLLQPYYAVHQAADGRAALQITRERSVDLVLADVMMPGLGGFDLLAGLRAHPSTAGVPVVLLSAQAGEEAAVEGLRAGADDYLVKPFSSHDLVARVRSNLELARLRSHEARWRTAMIDSLQDGFYVIDVDTAAIVEINPAMTELIGLRPEHLPCGPPYPIFPTADEDAAELAVLQSAYATAVQQNHGEIVVPLRHVDTRQRVWVSASYSALPARDGQGACYVATMRDVTAARRAAERESLLAAVGALLAEPVALADHLDRFARLVTVALAERAVVSLRAPDGWFTAAHAAGADADRAHPTDADPDDAHDVPWADPVIGDRSGRPVVLGRVLVVPLVMAGRTLGRVDLVGPGDGARAWDDADVTLVEELGRRIAGAVDADRVAVREAHRQAVTMRLAAAGTLVEAAAALVSGVRDALAARTVAVYAGEPDAPLRLAGRIGPGLPGDTVRPDLDTPPSYAVRTAQAVWIPDGDALLARFPDAPGWSGLAVTAIPLRTGDLVVGVLVAEFATARDFPADERDFATALTGQAAQAFERAALADQRWRLARTLQHALLPSTLPDLDRVGLAARYLPAMRDLQSGGDWYDVVALDGDRIAVAVGDVVGQGPAAAALMGQLRTVLATYLHDGCGPAEALEGLDRATRRIAGARGSTALCLVLDTRSGELRWSAAGHLPPLLTGPEGAGYLNGGEGTLLGLTGRPPYVEGRATADPGATIALYTDGLVERRGEVVDDGLDRLRAAAADLHELAPDPLARALLQRTLDDADTSDDVALVLARLLPAPLNEHFPADGAQVRALRRRILRWSGEAGLSQDTTGDLVLLVSEIVTNCVEHAYRDGPGEIVCGVGLLATGGVRVRVQDFGSWRPPPVDPGYRGRGLAVVHTLAEHVELEATPHGTTVTLRLAGDTEPLAERGPADAAPQWWSRPIDPRRR